MSFRLADLKKSVRKAKHGYQVTPVRLVGRPHLFKVEFVLQQLEQHVGCPRRQLDPATLLDFIGDGRLGRGLLATMTQWYRVRPRTFTEVFENRSPGIGLPQRLTDRGITCPVGLRAWLYSVVNQAGTGYLDPDQREAFWHGQARSLGVPPEDLELLVVLDYPDAAILRRTAPRPSAVDVAAAYNARAHTTLLRPAYRLSIRSEASRSLLERTALSWAGGLGVEWSVESGAVHLFGRADALGCWTRHGRRVERAALELLAIPELAACELQGQIGINDRDCAFHWKADTLALLGAGTGDPFQDRAPGGAGAVAAMLRRERESGERVGWKIRQASHLIGVNGGVFLPHLELRRDDSCIHLRVGQVGERAAEILAPFLGKTPAAVACLPSEESEELLLQFPGRLPDAVPAGEVLTALSAYLEGVHQPGARREPLPRAA